MPRYSHVPKVFAEAPDAVRYAYRDFKEEKIKVGEVFKPKPIYAKSTNLSDEQYIVALGLHWNSIKSVGRKSGYDKIGVLVICKPTGEVGCTVRMKRYEQVSRRYDKIAEGLPDWLEPEKISEAGRRYIWDHNRTLFGALWPGESLSQGPTDPPDQNQRVLKMEPAKKDTPPVKAPPIKLLGPKMITVSANGVNVTGSREDIRALLFGEE